MLPEIH